MFQRLRVEVPRLPDGTWDQKQRRVLHMDGSPWTGPVVSPSALDTYAGEEGCQRKWAWTALAGVERVQPASAKLGVKEHGFLEAWLRKSQPPPADSVLGKSRAWEHFPLPAGNGLGLWQGLKSGLVCEQPFAFAYKGVAFYGLMDASFLDWIFDLKTTGDLSWAKTPEELAHNIQAAIYVGYVCAGGYTRARCQWVYAQTKGAAKSKPVCLEMTAEQAAGVLDKWITAAFEIHAHKDASRAEEKAAADAGAGKERRGTLRVLALPANWGACGAYGGCSFVSRCSPEPVTHLAALHAQEKAAFERKLTPMTTTTHPFINNMTPPQQPSAFGGNFGQPPQQQQQPQQPPQQPQQPQQQPPPAQFTPPQQPPPAQFTPPQQPPPPAQFTPPQQPQQLTQEQLAQWRAWQAQQAQQTQQVPTPAPFGGQPPPPTQNPAPQAEAPGGGFAASLRAQAPQTPAAPTFAPPAGSVQPPELPPYQAQPSVPVTAAGQTPEPLTPPAAETKKRGPGRPKKADQAAPAAPAAPPAAGVIYTADAEEPAPTPARVPGQAFNLYVDVLLWRGPGALPDVEEVLAPVRTAVNQRLEQPYQLMDFNKGVHFFAQELAVYLRGITGAYAVSSRVVEKEVLSVLIQHAVASGGIVLKGVF